MRGTRCRLFAVALLSAALGSSPLTLADSASWTQYQGDSAHTGHISGTINSALIQPAWSLTKAQLKEDSIQMGAVTDGASVYVTCWKENGTYQVISLNKLTGAEKWRQSFVPYASEVSAPSVGNGMVYVHQWGHSSGSASEYPYVIGMNAQTGAISFATSHEGQWSSGSRPTVAGNQVFTAGGYYGGLNSYNAATGSNQWFSNVNQQYGWIPAADAQRVYVYMGPASSSPGPQVGTLYAFNRGDGSSAFTIPNPQDSHTLYDGTVSLGSLNDAITLTQGTVAGSYALASFDLLNRNVRWRTYGNFNGALAIDQGIIFAANGIELDTIDELTGTILNKWFVPPGRHLTGNLLVNDNLIFAQTDLTTYAIDRSTLQPVWSTNMVGDLALGDGVLVITNSNAIAAFVVPEPATVFLTLAAGLILVRRPRSCDTSRRNIMR